jgi:heat shock protein HtpX
MNDKQYSITVTSGLINALNDAEIESVLGHELTHIRNGDVRMLVIAVIIAGVIAFFAELVFRLMFQGGMSFRRSSSSDRKGGGVVILIAIALIAVAWILSVVIRFALSRKREYLADAGSVELTKNPDAMISALRKIEGRGELPGATSAVMEMCIDNPRVGFSNVFDTHPSVDARVGALVKFAGGHDPGPLALPQPPEAPPKLRDNGQATDDQENVDQLAPTGPPSESAAPPNAGPATGPWGPLPPPLGGVIGGITGGVLGGGALAGAKPFLPSRPPVELGGTSGGDGNRGAGGDDAGNAPDDAPGPWGPRRK